MINQENPKITIITVTFNAEKYLERTIQSVINQNYKNIEYIIIDGKSTDNTINIIKKYEEYITYWISESDNGIYDAMNKGIDKATGEWLNFMNAGDSFVDKNTVSTLKKYFFKDLDIICGGIYYGNKKDYQKPKGLKYKFKSMFCHHQATFVKTSIMKRFKFNQFFQIAADYDFLLKCSCNGYKFKFIDIPIANYLGNGISKKNAVKTRIEDLFIQSKYLTNINKIYESNSLSFLLNNSTETNLLFNNFYNKFLNNIDRLKLNEKKFILYGFGTFGKFIYNQYSDSIILIIDKHSDSLNNLNKKLNIFSPEILNTYKNNYILITALGKEKEITTELVKNYNINKNFILKINI